MTRAQIEARIAELKVENEKAPGGAGTNARTELIRELEARLPCSAGSATAAEIQSGMDRQKWAENLILQLPINHDGRNGWLLNYGRGEFAQTLRKDRELLFNEQSQAINPPARVTGDLAQQAVGCGDPSCKDPNCDYGKHEDCSCVGAVIGQHDRSCRFASQPSPAATVETDPLYDSRNPNHGRMGGLRDTAAYPDINDAAHADPGPHERSSAGNVDAMREALRPFAAMAAVAHANHRDSRPFIFAFDTAIAQRLTVGDLRAAGRALDAMPTEPQAAPVAAALEAADAFIKAEHDFSTHLRRGASYSSQRLDEAAVRAERYKDTKKKAETLVRAALALTRPLSRTGEA